MLSNLARDAKIGREAQEEWAARSHPRFVAAQDAGRFVDEIVGVDAKSRKGSVRFDRDEAPRPDTAIDTLARLKPTFRPDGTITAGNAPGLNSGAATMVLADAGIASREGLNPIGRLVGHGLCAIEPARFG
ncbi:acetyl-CoA acetyltransferase [Novosphingobium sp. Rr 2-17]|uniref:thiolase family protein n=1 Tax=Novosphingobium sp. Rr 2-17 TaxID=555793 RepID=UPI0002699F1D|nr:acetyl-CoA acetyltransferase [Novosphingobium sp. Rr 2-17]EIZ77926.1 acetyl-CoA acetyltransferase [Novosphingobium sp. Rr 2-17]